MTTYKKFPANILKNGNLTKIIVIKERNKIV